METEFVLSLGEQQWTLPAGADTFTIGRASNADIRLPADDQISRIHARLTRDATTWTLHDESRNGTGLNGRRITAPTPLGNGDRIHIGRSVLTFHKSTLPDAAPYAPTAPDTDLPAYPAPAPEPPAPIAPAPAPPAPSAPIPAPTGPAPTDFGPDGAPWGPGPSGDAPAGHARTDPAPAGPVPEGRGPADDARASHARTGPAGSDPAPLGPSGGPAPGDFGPGGAPGGTSGEYDVPAGYPSAEEPWRADEPAPGGAAYTEPQGGAEYAGEAPYADEYEAPGAYEPDESAGRVGGEGGTWAAYPSADNPEPVRSPWEISEQVHQSEPNWNQSDSWPDASRGGLADRRLPGSDRRTGGAERRTPEVGRPLPRSEHAGPEQHARSDQHAGPEQPPGSERRIGTDQLMGADQLVGSDPAAKRDRDESDAVGTVRLPRVLAVAAGVIALGLIGNLIVAFLTDGPGGALRWLVPPGIALVVAMVLVLLDAAAPKYHRPGRFDVSVLVAIVVVLLGVGVGGFVLTAGFEYVGGYLTGNESGEDRLIKPVAKTNSAITFTVENVTYTGHFTRVEVMLANGTKQPVTIPIAGTTFTAADGTALHADTGRSGWPSRVAAGGTEHGTITFKGHLPDSANTAVLTFKSGTIAVAVPVSLTN